MPKIAYSPCQERIQRHEALEVITRRLEMQSEGDADDAHAAYQLAAHLHRRAQDVFNAGGSGGGAAIEFPLGLEYALGGAALA